MKKKTLVWFFSFVLLIALNLFITFKYMEKVQRVQASVNILDEIDHAAETVTASTPHGGSYPAEAEISDSRVANLKQFFRNHNSPLYDHAEFIVITSDKYQFDYRLLPAIAMQESTLCRAIPENSHNCWGWGIYGDSVIRFDSYPEAIDTVAKGIRENYIDKGLTTASKIMEKYTPSSNGSWARAVNTFMQALE